MVEACSLGTVIRTRRRDLGLTQEQLAERIGGGVRQAEISRLESDRVTLPRQERLKRIAAALELPIGELLARAGWTGAEIAFAPSEPTASRPDVSRIASETRVSSQLPRPIEPDSLVQRLRVAIEEADQTLAEFSEIRARIAALPRDQPRRFASARRGRLHSAMLPDAHRIQPVGGVLRPGVTRSGVVDPDDTDDAQPLMLQMVADVDHGDRSERVASADD